MNFNFLLGLGSITFGSIVLIMGLILKKKPTKIGRVNGFRNKHSMKNQEQWDFSQKVFAKNLIKFSWIPFVTSVLGFFVNEQNTPWGLWGVMTSFLVCMAMASFETRNRINSEFDKKEGN
ncbi:SdpI family protein [Arenibacter sp. M-2]|uniref:SdpI family protein n=1 Tax=Arenibacter sp. M-2 TaxID=3053612 RepID=UPI002570ADD9|nr:SdpI family protein [Arenibacter sp. M-2]MDL5514878.1 SdpI family protein [Arenibacter sp. M-2]